MWYQLSAQHVTFRGSPFCLRKSLVTAGHRYVPVGAIKLVAETGCRQLSQPGTAVATDLFVVNN